MLLEEAQSKKNGLWELYDVHLKSTCSIDFWRLHNYDIPETHPHQHADPIPQTTHGNRTELENKKANQGDLIMLHNVSNLRHRLMSWPSANLLHVQV